jgi:fumarate reductase flavoprotein subunit
VFGKPAGENAARYARSVTHSSSSVVEKQAQAAAEIVLSLLKRERGERLATIRDEMHDAMEAGVRIYRKADSMQIACDKVGELRERYRKGVKLDDSTRAFNTEWLTAIELGFTLDVAEVIAHSALNRRESRGSHSRLDEYQERDDVNFLKHTVAHYNGTGAPRIEYTPVTITKSQPKQRVYGGAGKKAEMT